MISYEQFLGGVRVRLEGKHVGTIQRVPVLAGDAGWQYTPKGSRNSGEVYPTLEACKASIESDDE